MSAGVDQVARWILARHPDLSTLDRDCDLIEQRYVDSLSFLEFIVLIERLTGKPIDVEALDIDSFRSLATIEHSYFTPPSNAVASPKASA